LSCSIKYVGSSNTLHMLRFSYIQYYFAFFSTAMHLGESGIYLHNAGTVHLAMLSSFL